MKKTTLIILFSSFIIFIAAACAKTETEELKRDLSIELDIQTNSIDRDQKFIPHSYAKMLATATPSVVSVTTERIVQVSRGGISPQDELLRRFFGLPTPNQEQGQPEERRVPQGVGSGVIISTDGYIVTNNHVVASQQGEDADAILVLLGDGRELEAEIVGRDPLTDVAILKVEAEDLPAIKISDSDNIQVGDVVFAIGNPLGVGLTVTQGIISATQRQIGIYGDNGYESFIQTDASINPGNSGGALIDSLGRLIGVNSAILSQSGGNIGLGFAIPSNLATNIAKQLVDSGEVRRGFLGVSISDLTPDLAEAFQIEEKKGVLINDVEEDSAADLGGLERGDVLVGLNGKSVETSNEFRIRVANTLPGTPIELEIVRNGKNKILNLNVGTASGRLAMSANELIEGVEVSTIDEDQSKKYRIPLNVTGLLINSVDPQSPYSRHLSEGMVIMEINDIEITTIKEAREQIKTGVNKLYIFNRGRTGYLPIRVE
ncbi:MAG: Do family serine endopeptidase [Verrucomicrobia bacterium]|nr:Do family serine endopeptidase [Verrucomicrobiota bacterium]